jgi:hypothetical protein
MACALSLTLMAATCWRWSGAQARMLSLEEAADALHHNYDAATGVAFSSACEIIESLQRLASQDSAVGAHARHALEHLRRKLDR